MMVYVKSVLVGAIAAVVAMLVVVAMQIWTTGRGTESTYLVAFGSAYVVDIHLGPVLLVAAVAFIGGFVWRVRRGSA